jgi:hypothetical protein
MDRVFVLDPPAARALVVPAFASGAKSNSDGRRLDSRLRRLRQNHTPNPRSATTIVEMRVVSAIAVGDESIDLKKSLREVFGSGCPVGWAAPPGGSVDVMNAVPVVDVRVRMDPLASVITGLATMVLPKTRVLVELARAVTVTVERETRAEEDEDEARDEEPDATEEEEDDVACEEFACALLDVVAPAAEELPFALLDAEAEDDEAAALEEAPAPTPALIA